MLDIETAPNRVLTWGLFKQNVGLNQIEESGYTLCWAAKWHNNATMHFASVYKDGKVDMFKGIYDLLEEADVVVHYNGTRFDLPILMQEFAALGWTPPSPFSQIDLMRVVKNRFRLLSNKLDYVAQYFGLGNKLHHKGMELWIECMAMQPAAWKKMEAYNKQDVTLLIRLYPILIPWIPNHPNYGLFMEGDEQRCPNCGSTDLQKRGKAYTATLTYQRYRCNGCGAWSKTRTTDTTTDTRKRILKGI